MSENKSAKYPYLSFLKNPVNSNKKMIKKSRKLPSFRSSKQHSKARTTRKYSRNSKQKKSLSNRSNLFQINSLSSSTTFWKNSSLNSTTKDSSKRSQFKKFNLFSKKKQKEILLEGNDDLMKKEVSQIDEWMSEKKFGNFLNFLKFFLKENISSKINMKSIPIMQKDIEKHKAIHIESGKA